MNRRIHLFDRAYAGGYAKPSFIIGTALLIYLAILFMACSVWADEKYDKAILSKGIILEKNIISEKDNMEMVLIPAGKFIRGDNAGNHNEKPEHRVYLDDYLIDIYPVSNAQFEKFVNETGYTPEGPWKRGYEPGQRYYPVRFVSWNDAHSYAAWAGKRLPTEAEWEKAAKGIYNYKYPWGNEWKKSYVRTSASISFKPAPVNAFPEMVSTYGCFGMAGGVWEWTNDWYDRYAYEKFESMPIVKNPTGPGYGAQPEQRFIDTETAAGNEISTLKVIKGGTTWGTFAKDNSRNAKRMWGNPAYWFNDTGFRCAMGLEQ
jgi:formylglycine-generating enzyme required for sulfatase activity